MEPPTWLANSKIHTENTKEQMVGRRIKHDFVHIHRTLNPASCNYLVPIPATWSTGGASSLHKIMRTIRHPPTKEHRMWSGGQETTRCTPRFSNARGAPLHPSKRTPFPCRHLRAARVTQQPGYLSVADRRTTKCRSPAHHAEKQRRAVASTL